MQLGVLCGIRRRHRDRAAADAGDAAGDRLAHACRGDVHGGGA